jgi:phosphoglycolate phosphatase
MASAPLTTSTKLILWDIDGTILLVKRSISDELFTEMCREVYGAEVDLPSFRYSGKTDRGIIHELGGLAGLEEVVIEERLEAAMDFVTRGLEARLDEKDIRLLPNVTNLLEIFDKHESVVQGLLTGNLPGTAALKLRPFGIERYFKFGVFGMESRDRNDLGPIALERAIEHMPHPPKDPKDVIIIGDSVRDVECAKSIGATCIITLTGHSSREEIEQLTPDHIVDDLTDTDQVVRMVLGGEA